MQFERRADVSMPALVVAPFAAISVALLLCAGLIAAAGVNPLTAYGEMLKGALGSRLSITETLTRAVPLIFTGLAAAVAFRARVWNIGAEGQFYIGALVTAALGHSLFAGLPTAAAIPLIMATSILAGGLLLMVPVALRLRFGVDEVVVTLLMNFIVLLFVGLMVEGPLKDPMAFGWPQSVAVAADLRLPKLVPRSRLHIGFLVAILAAVIVLVIQARTVFGAETRAAGLAPKAAAFAGVPLARRLMMVALLSGGLAGLAGSVEVLGPTGYVTTTMSPGCNCTDACENGANSSNPTTGPPSSRRRTPDGPTTNGGLCPALVYVRQPSSETTPTMSVTKRDSMPRRHNTRLAVDTNAAGPDE